MARRAARCQPLNCRPSLRWFPTPLLQLGVHLADDPVLCAWKGAALLAASPEYGQLAVTRQEWRQRGMAACSRWDV